MNTIRFAWIIGLLVLISCSSTYQLTNSKYSPELKDSELNDLMIMVLYPDNIIETRVALEISVADEFTKKGLKAYCAYKSFSSYENLENKTDEIKSALEKNSTKNLLLIDPIRSLEHDESRYYDEVAIYRALGMESTEFWSTVGELAESADASRFVMGVLLWNLDSEDFIWQGTYDIKAPGGYDLQMAKEYAKEFADIILKSIEEAKKSTQ